jgi:hypothetical protein
MLVYGTANPEGEEDAFMGVYLKRSDITEFVKNNSLVNLPLKIEHTEQTVGTVISAWQHNNRLDCVIRINDDNIDGVFAKEFVKNGLCPELSLSYSVTMQHSKDGLTGDKKELLELSLVKRGARDGCRIYGYSTR